MSDEKKSFIQTPKQLVIIVVLAFAVPIAVFVLLSQLVTGVRPAGSRQADEGVLNRIRPVGELTLVDASKAKDALSGEQVYQTTCKTCHEAGLVGAPRIGDKAAWAQGIKEGLDELYSDALHGTSKGMPPKGGNPDLSDVEVKRAVAYMANRSGARFQEPAAAAPPAAPATGPSGGAAPATEAVAAPPKATSSAAAKPVSPLDLKTGEAVMQKDGCAACHAVDKKIVGPAYQDVAAKYKGDSAALAKLTQKVKAGGSGVWGPIPMPPNAQVPDEEIKALVSWILTLKK